MQSRRAFMLAATLCAGWPLVGCAVRGAGPAAAAGSAPLVRSPGEWFVDAPGAPLPDALNAIFDPVRPIDFLLLGEVHDHPLQHRLRVDWLNALARRGRFVLAMEQFDVSRQADIDRARAAGLPAGEIARAAGFQKGWNWALYEPYVELALTRNLPLVAANLSATQTRSIARGEAHPLRDVEPSGWSDEDRQRLAEGINDGHCGMLPASAIAPMAAAQRARDATLARAIADARRDFGLPVVLLAGNGHVRRDLGVPRYLRDLAPGARIFNVGLVEQRGADNGPAEGRSDVFDLTIETPAHPRSDPCAVFRKTPPPGEKS